MFLSLTQHCASTITRFFVILITLAYRFFDISQTSLDDEEEKEGVVEEEEKGDEMNDY